MFADLMLGLHSITRLVLVDALAHPRKTSVDFISTVGDGARVHGSNFHIFFVGVRGKRDIPGLEGEHACGVIWILFQICCIRVPASLLPAWDPGYVVSLACPQTLFCVAPGPKS